MEALAKFVMIVCVFGLGVAAIGLIANFIGGLGPIGIISLIVVIIGVTAVATNKSI